MVAKVAVYNTKCCREKSFPVQKSVLLVVEKIQRRMEWLNNLGLINDLLRIIDEDPKPQLRSITAA